MAVENPPAVIQDMDSIWDPTFGQQLVGPHWAIILAITIAMPANKPCCMETGKPSLNMVFIYSFSKGTLRIFESLNNSDLVQLWRIKMQVTANWAIMVAKAAP